MILDRPTWGRQPGPLRSPLNTAESTETMCKDDWLKRLGDHGPTVIMAVPPTAHAMSGIHQQHDPVDVKSLGDAIHSAAHQCARPESVRGEETVVRRASMLRGPCVISHARPTGQWSTDLWIASRSLPHPRTRRPRHDAPLRHHARRAHAVHGLTGCRPRPGPRREALAHRAGTRR
jgi:hypothetical protein